MITLNIQTQTQQSEIRRPNFNNLIKKIVCVNMAEWESEWRIGRERRIQENDSDDGYVETFYV